MQDYTEQIDHYLRRLFPITRSITGDGNRETLKILQEVIPLEIKEYPSGQHVYDWVIPKEWNIKDAWIKNSKGEKIVDFQKNNLHLVSYSIRVHKKLPFSELKKYLHYRKDLPEAIPYRTSYYEETWGFCVSYNDLNAYFHENEEYEVSIDSSLTNGSLSIGELLIKGKSSKEYLISTYICHPSMANDNLSGMILTAFLAKELLKKELNFSYRIVFVPETIGAIAYCANNEKAIKKIDCGFVVTTVGGSGQFGYKQSFDKDHFINKIIEQTFKESNEEHITYPFDIHGSDERQYSSPGFRINMATICKDRYYEYDYYHTSLDDLGFVKTANINHTLMLYLKTINKLDKNITYKNQYPCETMLSRHGLYPKAGGGLLPGNPKINDLEKMLWLLFYCDGTTDLFEISEKLNVDIESLYSIAHKLEEKGVVVGI
jgi:aminopeptidase-like protein